MSTCPVHWTFFLLMTRMVVSYIPKLCRKTFPEIGFEQFLLPTYEAAVKQLSKSGPISFVRYISGQQVTGLFHSCNSCSILYRHLNRHHSIALFNHAQNFVFLEENFARTRFKSFRIPHPTFEFSYRRVSFSFYATDSVCVCENDGTSALLSGICTIASSSSWRMSMSSMSSVSWWRMWVSSPTFSQKTQIFTFLISITYHFPNKMVQLLALISSCILHLHCVGIWK